MKAFKVSLRGSCKRGLYVVCALDGAGAVALLEQQFLGKDGNYEYIWDANDPDPMCETCWEVLGVKVEVEEMTSLKLSESVTEPVVLILQMSLSPRFSMLLTNVS